MNPASLEHFLQSARRGSTAASGCETPIPSGLDDSIILGFRQLRRDQAETLGTCAVVLRRVWIGVLIAVIPLLGWAQWFPPVPPAQRSALESLFNPSPDLDLSFAQP